MSRIIDNACGDAKALHRAGLMDDVTLREIETLGLPPVKRYSAEEIQAIRGKSRVSQSVFARVLNVGVVTVQKWERARSGRAGHRCACCR